jgi:dCTP deaminase
MILTGKEIVKRLNKDIIINPFNQENVNPNSYNLTLHDEMLIYKDNILDMRKNNLTEKIKIKEEGLMLIPGKLYLCRTVEYTETRNLIPMIEGRSSIGRLGIFIHITAGFGDIGFCGYFTLEISVIKPIFVYPFVKICQIAYHEPIGEIVEYSNKAKYQNNQGIQSSKFYLELLR